MLFRVKRYTALRWKWKMRSVIVRICLLSTCLWLSSFGSGAEAQIVAAAPQDPNVQRVRTFKVPLDFVVEGTAMDLLKKEGVEFPEGASAVFNRITSQLV